MSLEQTRQFDGSPVTSVVLQWTPRFDNHAANNAMTLTIAPKSTSFLGIGIEGKWVPRQFHLDPLHSAVRIDNYWIMISDIDAASQFAVEKESAVAFPHESKQIYVSGNVGLHIHVESTGEAFTLAFPEVQLADVAFDALNRLSYDQVSHEIFDDSDVEDEEDENTQNQPNQNQQQRSTAAATRRNSNATQPKSPRRDKNKPSAAAVHNQSQGSTNNNNHDDDDGDDGTLFVAQSGPEVLARGRGVNIHDFTAHFLEGGGMGSLAEATEGGGSERKRGPPNEGMMRLRKESGTLSTWIARTEEGDSETLYMMKLSKAMVKAPLNKIIKASPPSIAKHFGPVVAMKFAALTIRSETYHPQFVLEEIYENEAGETRVHRLICVFTNLEERMRWEDWLQQQGVKKKTIEVSQKKGGDAADGGGGAGGGADSGAHQQMDTTIRLIMECFDLDEVWEHPRDLNAAGDEDEEYEEEDEDDAQNSVNPFVADTPRELTADRSARLGAYSAEAAPGGGAGAGGGTASLTLDSAALMESPSRRLLKKKPKKQQGEDGSPTSVTSAEDPGAQFRIPQKTDEQEMGEAEAGERCRWFEGYSPPKTNRWRELGKALKKERSGGSALFTAALKLARQSGAQAASGVFDNRDDDFDEDGVAHTFDSRQGSGAVSPGSRLQQLLRDKTMTKTMSALQRREDEQRIMDAANWTQAQRDEYARQQESADAADDDMMQGLEAVEAIAAERSQQQKQQRQQQQEQMEQQHQQQFGEFSHMVSAGSVATANGGTAAASSSSSPDGGAVGTSNASSLAALQQHQNAAAAPYSSASHGALSPSSASAAQVLADQHQRSVGRNSSSSNADPAAASRARAETASTDGTSLSLSPSASQQRAIGGRRRAGTGASASMDYALPADGSMFGRPRLFGELPDKFSPIDLRSQGFTDGHTVAATVHHNGEDRSSLVNPTAAGTTATGVLPSSSSHPTSPNAAAAASSSSSTRLAAATTGGATSAAADAARDFSFGFNADVSSVSTIHPTGDWSPLTQQQNNSTNNFNHDNIVSQRYHDPAASSSSPVPPRLPSRRLNVDDSSDSDDEASQRFRNARAMRAVQQLGEEFVGPRSDVNFFDQQQQQQRQFQQNSNSHLRGSVLAVHVQPTCPLCGCDRTQNAICKRTGRLHAASQGPRFAEAARVRK